MNQFFLIFSNIKNNFKQMAPTICALVLTVGYAFVMTAFFVKFMFVDPSWKIWLAFALCFAVLIGLCLFAIYGAYFKVSSIRINTLRLVGANIFDIVQYVLTEGVIIFVCGVVCGVILDSIINASVCLFESNVHVFLNWKTFGITLGITAIAPFLATALSLFKHISANKIFCINK